MRAALLVLLASCGPTLTIYERTAPRRVEVTKLGTAPRLEISARFVSAESVEVIAKQTSDVKITRVVHYGAAAIERTRGNPLAELLELPIGLIFLLAGPVVWETPLQFEDTATSKGVLNTNYLAAMINPFQTAISYRVRVRPTTDADVFADRPATREVRMHLPAPKIAIAYRALDEGELEVAAGTLTTDAFGRASVENLARAIALEITVNGVKSVVPIIPIDPPAP